MWSSLSPANPMKIARILIVQLKNFCFTIVLLHQIILIAHQGMFQSYFTTLDCKYLETRKRYYYCARGNSCNLTDHNNRPNSDICWLDFDFKLVKDYSFEYQLNCVSIEKDILKTTIFQLNFNCDEELTPKPMCNIECPTKDKLKKSQLWMCFVVMGLGIGQI